MKLEIKKLSPTAKMPVYGSSAAAGADLSYDGTASVTIPSGETVRLSTGLAMAIPEGFCGLVYARSGLATKRGLAPANCVGVIDADYRGEVLVALHNHGKEDQTVLPGERIAQLVIAPVITCEFSESDTLPETVRGDGGFGSTGAL